MTEVNVNLVLIKYSSIFHIYQGIYRKNKFFVIYHKILCKHIYVNLINSVYNAPFFAPLQSHIWGNVGAHRSISAVSLLCHRAKAEIRKDRRKSGGLPKICRISQGAISSSPSAGGPCDRPPAARTALRRPACTPAGSRRGPPRRRLASRPSPPPEARLQSRLPPP